MEGDHKNEESDCLYSAGNISADKRLVGYKKTKNIISQYMDIYSFVDSFSDVCG